MTPGARFALVPPPSAWGFAFEPPNMLGFFVLAILGAGRPCVCLWLAGLRQARAAE